MSMGQLNVFGQKYWTDRAGWAQTAARDFLEKDRAVASDRDIAGLAKLLKSAYDAGRIDQAAGEGVDELGRRVIGRSI